MVAISRHDRYLGRYTGGRLCDRITAPRVILLGVAIGVPMLFIQPHGDGFCQLLVPLTIMTMGFGFSNVGATTFALQSRRPTPKR